MTLVAATIDRRRLVDALGLGPLWLLRRHPAEPGEVVGPETRSGRKEHVAALGWSPLQNAVATCTACALARSRTRTVFGTGPAHPRWLVVGGVPDAGEEAAGEPFVSEAGKLLDAMLVALGLSRVRDVFVADALKCRAPGDRAPTSDEMSCCHPFLERQIALLEPRLILAAGTTAGLALLGADFDSTGARGRPHAISIEGRAVPVVATHHPNDLLKSPERKAEVWADLCLARSIEEGLGATPS